MKNSLIPIAIIIAGAMIAGSVIFVSSQNTENTKGAAQPSERAGDLNLREVDDDDHIRGNPDADLLIVEYSDIQCPFCEQFHRTMKQVMDEYGTEGEVAWVYRHHPLDDYYGASRNLHPQAREAAIASECVAENGGNDEFWSFLDSMFNQQASLGQDLYVEEAVNLGINETEFEECLNDEEMLDRVIEDEQNGELSFGTPYSVVIDQDSGRSVPINGATPFNQVKQIIDGLLNS